ncbi:MAG: type II secretion system protein [Deltaproteobacteria bacterium]|nr:type II secretion system protein [Deltaproteobacteria bacterium]
MQRQAGFTLVELMVVVAILGIMGATAMPLYRTFLQRTYGSESALMAKQLVDAQIIYYLEHNKFFPEDSETIIVTHSTSSTDNAIQRIKDNLNVTIPTGHFLDYTLTTDNTSGSESFSVTVRVTVGKDFPLFSGGYSPGEITKTVSKDGEITTLAP